MYEFSLPTFFMGIGVIIAGLLLTRYYKVIADNLGGGLGSYEKYKIWGMVICGVGFLLLFNIPAFLLQLTLGGLFK